MFFFLDCFGWVGGCVLCGFICNVRILFFFVFFCLYLRRIQDGGYHGGGWIYGVLIGGLMG